MAKKSKNNKKNPLKAMEIGEAEREEIEKANPNKTTNFPESQPETIPFEPFEAPAEPEPVQIPESVPNAPVEEPVTVPDFIPEEWPEPVKDPTETPIEVPVGSVLDAPIDIGDAKFEKFDLLFQNKNNKNRKLVNASDNAYPDNELINMIQEQREDTSEWQNQENHSPNSNNPSTIVARVFLNHDEQVEGSKVLLQKDDQQIIGKIVVDAEDGFMVQWRTGQKSIEKKANYELIIVDTGKNKGL